MLADSSHHPLKPVCLAPPPSCLLPAHPLTCCCCCCCCYRCAVRGIAHAAHASFLVGHNLDLMAVYGALNTAGFGIAVAMCCCFIVIW
jgi:hypothetical protein